MVSYIAAATHAGKTVLPVTSQHAEETFCAGLLQGLPDGTEEEQLYQFEEEMERNSVMLRQYKSSNEQVTLSTPPHCLQPSRLTAYMGAAKQDGACTFHVVNAGSQTATHHQHLLDIAYIVWQLQQDKHCLQFPIGSGRDDTDDRGAEPGQAAVHQPA